MDNRPTLQPRPIEDDAGGISSSLKKRITLRRIFAIAAGFVILAVVALVAMYMYALSPLDANNKTSRSVEIVSGMMPKDIARHLEEKGIIRSQIAFYIHARLTGVSNRLLPGTYQLTRQMSTQAVVDTLVTGPTNEEFEVTFLPRSTLADNRKVLLEAGFSETEIDEALSASYDHPLFASKPSTADLEGYIFGETHRFIKGTSVKKILTRFFDEYYEVVQRENLVAKYKAQGLSLYQGITLASIIELESGGNDKAQITQIFLLRLKTGMELGSDVTYQYIADKEGKPRNVNYDSPYNTRRYTGLPPGPISSPGIDALKAVGNPASGDYVYFLSGDDNQTYYAKTLAEHEANIRNHCQKKCQII